MPPDFSEYVRKHGTDLRDLVMAALPLWVTWMPGYAVDVADLLALLELILITSKGAKGLSPYKVCAGPRSCVHQMAATLGHSWLLLV